MGDLKEEKLFLLENLLPLFKDQGKVCFKDNEFLQNYFLGEILLEIFEK